MHKKARKNKVGLGVFFSALALFWSFFDRYGFIPAIQKIYCVGWKCLRCPGRGAYTIHPVGEPTTCSEPTHH